MEKRDPMETEIMIEGTEENEEASITKVMEIVEVTDQGEETTRDLTSEEAAVVVAAEATKREEDTIKEEEVLAQAADDP